MKDIIKKVPIPLCGVMLGTAALGNLLQSYGEGIRNVCGIFAAFLLILVLLKLIMFPGMIKEDMGNPIMASVSGTFTMALMILSTYVKPYIGQAAYIIWLLAIILHIVLIVYFTAKFVVKLQMPKVFASYYIVYVGIVVAAVTAPAYEQLGIGAATFWFGFVTLILLLVLVTYRYVKFKEVPNPAKPLICIYAAPTSLCIAGYVQSVTPKSYDEHAPETAADSAAGGQVVHLVQLHLAVLFFFNNHGVLKGNQIRLLHFQELKAHFLASSSTLRTVKLCLVMGIVMPSMYAS